MAKLIETLEFKDTNDEELTKAFESDTLMFEFTPFIEEADKQVIKNTIALAINGIHAFGMNRFYVENYGITWRMWIGVPTEEEQKAKPFTKPEDPMAQLFDMIFNPKKTMKKDQKSGYTPIEKQ